MAVEVDGGNRQAEVVELGEVAGAEVLPPPGSVHCLPTELLEEQKHQPVDSEHRPRALVAHDLSPYTHKNFIKLALGVRFVIPYVDRTQVVLWIQESVNPSSIPKDTPVVAGMSVTSLH